MPGDDALKRIPQHLIAAATLIDREIALEHRTLRAEGGNAGLDIGPPGLLQILRGGRLGLFKEIEADHLHAETAELDISVGEARDLLDLGAPSGAATPQTNSVSPSDFSFLRPIGSVHRAGLLVQRCPDVVAAPNIGEKVGEQVGVTW